MTEGANARGDMRLEAESVRPAYGLPTWFPEDSGAEEFPRLSEGVSNWHPPAPHVARRHRESRDYTQETQETQETQDASEPARRQRVSRDYAEETQEAFEPPRRQRPLRRRAAPAHHIARAAAAGALSVLIGALTALLVFDITSGGSVRNTVSAILTGAPLPAGGDSSQSTIAKKVVVTARIDALDVSGSADMPIPLSLKAEAGMPDQSVALKLSGIPQDAYLTAGTKLGASDWLLKPGQELGVKLVVPDAPPLPLSLAVAAIEPSSGELVAPVREFKVAVAPNPDNPDVTVEPANAPPPATGDFAVKPEAAESVVKQAAAEPVNIIPAAATPLPEPASEASALIQRGDALIEAGEFAAARPFYDRALEQGDLRAAFKLARTYDPEIFAQHQVRGLRPDAAQALKYYRQAAAGGITEAQAAMARLGMK